MNLSESSPGISPDVLARSAAENIPLPSPMARRAWTPGEIEIIRAACACAENPVNIEALAQCLGRTYYSVAIKASRMGFGNFKRPKRKEVTARRVKTFKKNYSQLSAAEKDKRLSTLRDYAKTHENPFAGKKHGEEARRKMASSQKLHIQQNGHNRGMLGKHHTDATKRALSLMWAGKKIPREQVVRGLKTKVLKYGSLNPHPGKRGGTWKAQWVEVGGKRFFARSLWEANYGRYLEWLKQAGEVVDWQHEPETFWFDGLKRGCVSYLPDFRVDLWTGAREYHEVKGWMDQASKTKIRRMAKYHPEITLVVIDSERYQAIARKAKYLVPDWNAQPPITTQDSNGATTKSPANPPEQSCG